MTDTALTSRSGPTHEHTHTHTHTSSGDGNFVSDDLVQPTMRALPRLLTAGRSRCLRRLQSNNFDLHSRRWCWTCTRAASMAAHVADGPLTLQHRWRTGSAPLDSMTGWYRYDWRRGCWWHRGQRHRQFCHLCAEILYVLAPAETLFVEASQAPSSKHLQPS